MKITTKPLRLRMIFSSEIFGRCGHGDELAVFDQSGAHGSPEQDEELAVPASYSRLTDCHGAVDRGGCRSGGLGRLADHHDAKNDGQVNHGGVNQTACREPGS